MKLVNSTPNGQVFICHRQRIAHVEFGNVFLKLTYKEFNQLVEYVNTIDYCYYLRKNAQAQNKRKLLLNIGFEDMFVAMHESEFLEFKSLLSLKPSKAMLRCGQIVMHTMQWN